MNNQQLSAYLSEGLRNVNGRQDHCIGDEVFVTMHNSNPLIKILPCPMVILDSSVKKGSDSHYLVGMDGHEKETMFIHYSWIWTKEEIIRKLVCGPKGKKGARKYKRIMNKMRRIN